MSIIDPLLSVNIVFEDVFGSKISILLVEILSRKERESVPENL